MVGQILVFMAVAGWAAMAFAMWRIVRLFGGWSPAVANVERCDYTENQQWEDRWLFNSPMMTSRGFNWRDGEDERLIEEDIVYTLADGTQHRAIIERRVLRGWRPSTVYTVWVNDEDPSRVTVRGPLYWSMVMLTGIGVMGVSVWHILQHGGLAAVLAH